jgi:hypothetical protein
MDLEDVKQKDKYSKIPQWKYPHPLWPNSKGQKVEWQCWGRGWGQCFMGTEHDKKVLWMEGGDSCTVQTLLRLLN